MAGLAVQCRMCWGILHASVGGSKGGGLGAFRAADCNLLGEHRRRWLRGVRRRANERVGPRLSDLEEREEAGVASSWGRGPGRRSLER